MSRDGVTTKPPVAPTATSPSGLGGRTPGGRPGRMGLIRSEILKIRTTNTWWLFLIGIGVAVLGALAVWMLLGHFTIEEAERVAGQPFVPPEGVPDGVLAELEREHERNQDITRTLNQVAAWIYPAGRLFGAMFSMLLGILVVTNEFRHQTATATFLTTPTRGRVVAGKLAATIVGAGFFWLAASVVSLAAGAIFFAIEGYGPQLGEWPVLRAILLNGVAYGLWGVIGVGLGAIMRNQLAAVLVGGLTYLIGGGVVTQLIVPLLLFVVGWEWIVDVMVAWPGVATSIMISPEPILAGAPDWWVGALVLIGYAVLAAVIGSTLIRKRDIS